MRVAFLIWTGRRVAGREAHAATIIPALKASGIELTLVCDVDRPTEAEPIATDVPVLCSETIGEDRVLSRLRAWKPDVLYDHGLINQAVEAQLLSLAPAVFFAHQYSGTCISGAKAYSFPMQRPCHRLFGWQCLMHYYPHRCGGLNPLIMIQDFRRQAARLRFVHRYEAIVTHSQSMIAEYLKHGVPSERLHLVPYCVDEVGGTTGLGFGPRLDSSIVRLVFVGRLTAIKGGDILLAALPKVRASLPAQLHLTFVGDGPARSNWERRAGDLCTRDKGLKITFTGWLSPAERDAVLDQSDLLVVPSVFPEPFGLVGVEAARRGVPAAAFAVGGIPEWLQDGVSGHLAPGDPPTAQGLAEAIVRCLEDPGEFEHLRRGALNAAEQHTVQAHIDHVVPILASVIAQAQLLR